VATVLSFLKDRGAAADFYIPCREREGYGISREGVRFAAGGDFSLLIALDCGIRDIENIGFAREEGLDVIVCDHHMPGAVLPPANVILNPKQDGCSYPYKELSGCGIGFKLITALARHLVLPAEEAFRYLDLTALSIAADVVPVTGENRVLASYGLKKLHEDPLPGLRALLATAVNGSPETPLTLEDLAFRICPAVNAAGRMGDAGKAVRLFVEKESEIALGLAEELQQDNQNRKALDKSITGEALDMIAGSSRLSGRRTTVLYNPGWHKGVIGIVASRVMETWYRPTIILTESGGRVAGSARSVEGFNILTAISRCGHLLENYGGHSHAAGLQMTPENLDKFSDAFEEVVCSSGLTPADPAIGIEAEISLPDIPRIYPLLRQFEPFGPGNPRPVFISRRLRDSGDSRLLRDGHIRFDVVEESGNAFGGIGFGLGDKYSLLGKGCFDLCYSIRENNWRGKTSLQLEVLDIRTARREITQ
jgi:single-stranded-DNA-specific exonuclease